MKKVLALFLFATMIFSVFGSCSAPVEETPAEPDTSTQSPPESDAPTEEASVSGTLSILSWYDESRSENMMTTFQEMYPDVEIDYQYSPPVADYVEKLSTLLYSDAAPDLFYMALENREDLIKGDYVLDLSQESYMTDGTIPEAAKGVYNDGDSVYALSIAGWMGGILYNKDIFAEAGIETLPETWDEFLEVNQTLMDAGITPMLDNCQDAAANFPVALYNAEVFSVNPDNAQQVYDGETTFAESWEAPAKMWGQLIENGYIDANMVGITSDDVVAQFATEQVAMIFSGSWNINTINEINPELNYEFMGVPGSEPGNSWYAGALDVGVCINKNATNMDAAKAFVSFIASPEGQEAYYNDYGGFLLTTGFTPELSPVVADAAKAAEEGRFRIPLSDWRQHTESLRLTFLAALQDAQVGKIAPEEVGVKLDEKLAEVSQ